MAAAVMSQPTPFTKWPPEIRNAIYEALFELDSPILIKTCWTRIAVSWDVQGINLLATCKLINHEARGMLYSRNVFRFDSEPETMEHWLTRVSARRSLLRSLQLEFSNDFSIYYSGIEIGPLLNQLGFGQGPGTDISFVAAENTAMIISRSSEMARANRLLDALRPSASPHIAALARATGNVSSPVLAGDGDHVSFRLLGASLLPQDHFSPVVEYELSQTGHLVRVASSAPKPSLMGVLDCSRNPRQHPAKTFLTRDSDDQSRRRHIISHSLLSSWR